MKVKRLEHSGPSEAEEGLRPKLKRRKGSAAQKIPVNDKLEKDEGEVETAPRLEVSHGYHLVRGQMGHGMEDYIVAENREFDCHELGLYAIFDGHSGSEVAKYLQRHLFNNILNMSDILKDPKRAMKRAYELTDEEVLENVVGLRGGSTAVTAILVDRQRLIVGNVGDSRAVLCKRGKAKQTSVDHDPESEKELVESRGGCVTQRRGNIPRVDGQLAMTRAFGDAKVKEHITSEPDVRIEEIDDDTQFIILASDGVWKVMSNEEAFDCIRNSENGKEAERVVKEALSRGSKDDISCIVVAFH